MVPRPHVATPCEDTAPCYIVTSRSGSTAHPLEIDSMTTRTRDDELKEVPLWKANKATWPPGVRTVGLDEADCLGIDRRGNLYWDGKEVEVRHFSLTRRQAFIAVVVAVSAVIGAVGAFAQGWVAYHDWACRVAWPAITCEFPPRG